MSETEVSKDSNKSLLKLIALILAIGVGYYIYDNVSKRNQEECIREATAEKRSCLRSLSANICTVYDHKIEKCYE